MQKIYEVQEYINQFHADVQLKLNNLRQLVFKLAPNAEERMCMGTISYRLNKKLFVHFAAYKKHIGFYPDSDAIAAFKEQLIGFKTGTGTVQFPLDKNLPLDLIEKIILFKKNSIERDMKG